MKFYLSILCILGTLTEGVFAQNNITSSNPNQNKGTGINNFPNFNRRLQLDEKPDTTANMSFGDLDGDGHLDIVLVKGRHWPIVDRVLLGDGVGGIRKAYNLGNVADRSYTGGLSDFNSDGFLDIAISNDAPDRKLIYFNDGKGNFKIGSEFGIPEWPTRNLSIADINADGLPDIILANRGNSSTSNYICLNSGKGQFSSNGIPFAHYPSSTIFPVDFNKDGFIDLVVPHRDGGQSFVYLGSAEFTYADTHRIPFGSSGATIRMASVADFNADNIPDVVAIDENKGVNIFFGKKDQTFSAGISIADSTIAPYAVAISDLNNDGKIDIIVGYVKAQSTVFFNDGTGRNFISVPFGDSEGTVYGLAVSDFNEDGQLDIGAARSDAPSVLYFGSIPPKKKNKKHDK